MTPFVYTVALIALTFAVISYKTLFYMRYYMDWTWTRVSDSL